MGDEFKAILAHELGHIKRQDTKFPTGALWRSNMSPLVYMVGALVGTYAVRSYLEHRKEKSQPIITEDASAAVAKNLEVPKEHKGTTFDTISKIGIYTGMAILGSAVGMMRLRSIRQNMEFACDAFSKELMGSGKPLASALSKFHEHSKQMASEALSHLPPEQREKLTKAVGFVESFLHPPVPKRVEALLR